MMIMLYGALRKATCFRKNVFYGKIIAQMRILRLILLMLAGAALSLAFPKASLWPLAWVGIIPLLLTVKRARTRAAFLSGLVFGFGYFLALLHWIGIFGYLPWVLLSLMQALFIAAFAVLVAVIYRARRPWLDLAAIPALWTVLEWTRSLGTFGFTWGDLAYSQAPNLAAIQISSITGPLGLTFAIVLVNVALAADKHVRLFPIVAAVLLTAVLHVGGAVSLTREQQENDQLLVALAQGSIDQELELTPELRMETVEIYTELTYKAADMKPDFIVWPETVVPDSIVTSPATREWISELAARSKSHMLVGAPHDQPATSGKPATEMNGAYMFGPDGSLLGSYYKVHLVPFGEFVPWRKLLPFLERYRVRTVDVTPGKEHNLLKTDFGDVGVTICFESIFPEISRKVTRDGAKLLFVITNDGWFRTSPAAAQHHDFSVFRAVENRRYIVRNGATGISSVIDPYGRVLDQMDIWEQGVLYGDVSPRSDLTPYARFGNWFVYLSIAFSAIGLASGALVRKRRKPGHPRARSRK